MKNRFTQSNREIQPAQLLYLEHTFTRWYLQYCQLYCRFEKLQIFSKNHFYDVTRSTSVPMDECQSSQIKKYYDEAYNHQMRQNIAWIISSALCYSPKITSMA